MNQLLNPDEVTLPDPNADYLSELVGPGKKYANERELAKAYYHADKTIEVQNKRIDQFRSDFERERAQNLAREQLEEIMTRYQNQQQIGQPPQMPNEVQQPQITTDQIESLINTKILETKTRDVEQNNFNMVKNKLVERFGNRYQEAIGEKINKLGMTGDELDVMARTKPQVAMSILGLFDPGPEQSRNSFQAPMRSSFQQPFSPTASKERTWSYYQDLKAKDPKTYRSEKIQNQMTADYVRLGPAFEDGDYHSQEY